MNVIDSVEFLIRMDGYTIVDNYQRIGNSTKFDNVTQLVYDDGSITTSHCPIESTLDYILTRIDFAEQVYDTEGYSYDVIIYYKNGMVDYKVYDGMVVM